MATQDANKASGKVCFQRGQPFNPFRMFTGHFIPAGLACCTWISPGAKLAWGRLARYGGHKGLAYPAKTKLGQQIGVGSRQAQKYITELERQSLIRRVSRFSGRGQTSNAYEFLWHELFEEGENDRSPKESQSEESHSQESQDIDLDYPSTNRKNRDSRLDARDAPSTCKQYPRLREALADYMVTADDDERVYPSDRLVVDVMNAAAAATEEEVIQCLRYLKDERGLRPGTKHGPRRFG